MDVIDKRNKIEGEPLWPTWVKIDLRSMQSNIHALRSCVKPGTLFMAVIKANGYGHGLLAVAHAAIEAGADYLGVATLPEALTLRQDGIASPILILGPTPSQFAYFVVANDISAAAFDAEFLTACQEAAVKLNKAAHLHLKIDTGLHRIGVWGQSALKGLLEHWKLCPNVTMEGLFSHFSNADGTEERDRQITARQMLLFDQAIATVKQYEFSPLCHLCNSAGTLYYPEAAHDMVRCGISMYGYAPGGDKGTPVDLQQVLSLRTTIARIETLSIGECVSYGATYEAETDRLIATLPLGYGDGYRRNFGGKAEAIVRGKRAPVVGRICMDQCMIDVTDVPEVKLGDEVILLGRQGNETIDADEWGRWIDSISYEMLLGISARVTRVYDER